MEFEKSSYVDNLVFQKITEIGNLYRVMEFHFSIEVGNLCRAGRTLKKTGHEPGTPPPIWCGGGLTC